MSTVTAVPASASEAMAMVHAGLAFLASTDAAAMGSAAQAASLQGLEEANSVATAARLSILGAFAAGQSGRCRPASRHPRWRPPPTIVRPRRRPAPPRAGE